MAPSLSLHHRAFNSESEDVVEDDELPLVVKGDVDRLPPFGVRPCLRSISVKNKKQGLARMALSSCHWRAN
jgi:hypothetical protein